MWNNTDKCKLSLPRILSAGEGSTNFISWTELGIYRTLMFVFTLSGSHFDLTLTEEHSYLGVTFIFKLPHLTSICSNMMFKRGGRPLTLTLELWQNDIFLILMWINFTIYRIMQLIFRNRSYWKCPLCRIMTDVLFREIKQRSTFPIWLLFCLNFSVPSRYTYTYLI